MGSCICKEKRDSPCSSVGMTRSGSSGAQGALSPIANDTVDAVFQPNIDSLILETLEIIRKLIDNNIEPPSSMLKLHAIAERENGWLAIVNSMLNTIPLDDPLGPAVITLLLDECPLPTKKSIELLLDLLKQSPETDLEKDADVKYFRNICVILGFIADKMAGPTSVALLTDYALEFLVSSLNPEVNPSIILFSLVALEKFSQTSENKCKIVDYFAKNDHSQLSVLESWEGEDDYVKHQVAFCAKWCLDNLYVKKGRTPSYLTIDRTDLNAMLNGNDVSEYLKISADGLQARSDAPSFESVRCTFPVRAGVWYYEVTVITSGVMQIGWATKDSKFLNHEGYGIGDDEFSLAYDGCRQLIWFNATSQPHSHRCWQPGNVLGTLLDLDNGRIYFYLNGVSLPRFYNEVFKSAWTEFFAAASFMSFQHCQFNFGLVDFKFPPKNIRFSSFNDHASLKDHEKIILPRHLQLQLLQKIPVKQDCCSICFDKKASVKLSPCDHSGFCTDCALLLDLCPMCRSSIHSRLDVL